MTSNLHRRVGWGIVAAYAVSVGLLGIVAITSLRNIDRSATAADRVNLTHALILEAGAVLASLHAGEAALKDYLITANERDLTAARMAYAETAEHVEIATALAQAEPGSGAYLDAIARLLEERSAFAREVVKARQANDEEGIRKLVTAHAGDVALTGIQRQVESLIDHENDLLQQRDRESYTQAQATKWIIVAGLGLNLVLLCFAGWVVRDDLHARQLAATALESANRQLESKVAERTAALEQQLLEWKWQNQALLHQSRYHGLIFNSIDGIVFVVTKTLRISRLNPAAASFFQTGAGDLAGQPLDHVLELGDSGQSNANPGPNPIGASLQRGQDLQNRPCTLILQGDRRVPARLSAFPLRDRDKVVGGVITIHPLESTDPKPE
jgi:CHASE3 domain sensor protein